MCSTIGVSLTALYTKIKIKKKKKLTKRSYDRKPSFFKIRAFVQLPISTQGIRNSKIKTKTITTPYTAAFAFVLKVNLLLQSAESKDSEHNM
jgi:hypothetical protein